ncbi:ATP-binding cassette domain-containing protein [Micromonospora sp. NPDC050495]|uniref:phosphonate ABC transporter ATP-binding protein n=1 Tax=Micromonospora sp. NPDC050495 TaxID=3154936 RepID=UPI0033F6B52D
MEIRLTEVTVALSAHRPPVLDGIDLTVTDGQQVALLGPSGAGKSTLLRVVLGAVRPLAGQVRVDGLDPYGRGGEVTRIRRATGIVRQRDDLVRGLSARANVLMGQSHHWRLTDWLVVLRGRVPHRHAARLQALARRHEVDAFLDVPIENLSGGQRQRVALVRALLSAPRLLLADESTSGLDPRRAEEALADLRRADGATLVVTTHDLAVARQFPRIIALREGSVVFDGAALTDDTVHEIYGRRPVGVGS